MANMPIVKLETNIPVVIAVKRCEHWPEAERQGAEGPYKAPAQIALVGAVKGVESRVYLPIDCGKELAEKGWIKNTGRKNKWKRPIIDVIGSPRLQITKKEDGKKKVLVIEPAGGAPSAPAQAGKSPAPAGSMPPAGEQGFKQLEADMTRCLGIAKHALPGILGRAPTDELVVNVATTLFIQGSRDGIHLPIALPQERKPAPKSEPPADAGDAYDEQEGEQQEAESEGDDLPF